MTDTKPLDPVTVGPWTAANASPLLWILGPCVIESRDLTLRVADFLAGLRDALRIPVVFKASFDKANRSSGATYRGPGLHAGLEVLAAVRERTGLPVTTDVHAEAQVAPVAQVVDLIQIPAFLARQTDLLHLAGKTGKPVNVKKGQFMAPADMWNVAAKLQDAGCAHVLLTERGTTFGYGRLVNDMQAIPRMRQTGKPVVFDGTHSVQTPGGKGDRSGGDRRMVPYLTRAAVAAGCDGVFLETHPDPDRALSDGPNMLPLDALPTLVKTCLRLRDAVISS